MLALATMLVALQLGRRAPTDRRIYGWRRVDFLAAQVGGVLLIASCAWVAIEAVRRLGSHHAVNGASVVLLAAIGLVVNGASALAPARLSGGSLRERGALLHLLGDAAGSALVLVAGVTLVLADARGVDSVTSLVLAVVVAVAGVRLVRDSSHLLLDGTPWGLDVNAGRPASPPCPPWWPCTTCTCGRWPRRPRRCRPTWCWPTGSRCTTPRSTATACGSWCGAVGIAHATLELEHGARRTAGSAATAPTMPTSSPMGS